MKKNLAYLLFILSLGCIVTTVYQYLFDSKSIGLFSFEMIGAMLFHTVTMIIAVFLISGNPPRENQHSKEA